MNNPELAAEEHRKQPFFSWMYLLKIAICILIIILVCLLVKDYIMPKQTVNIGISSVSPGGIDTLTDAK